MGVFCLNSFCRLLNYPRSIRDFRFTLNDLRLFNDFQKIAAIFEEPVANGAGPKNAYSQIQRFFLIQLGNEHLDLLTQETGCAHQAYAINGEIAAEDRQFTIVFQPHFDRLQKIDAP